MKTPLACLLAAAALAAPARAQGDADAGMTAPPVAAGAPATKASAAAPGPAEHLKSKELSARIQRGIDDIYKMEFDDCEKTFDDILRDYPGLPYGHFGRAVAAWARFEYEKEESDPSLDNEFELRTEEAIAAGKAWLKAHPNDAEGHMCVSGMYGLRSRMSMMLHRWIRAYFDGSKALKLLRRAQQLDPELYDTYTGLGMYDYYTGTLPSVIRVLSKLVLVKGDWKGGLDKLKVAAEKGEHTSTAAKLLLVEVMQDRAAPAYAPKEGLERIREIRRMFPKNPLFHSVEGIYLYENGLGDEAARAMQDYLAGIAEGRPYYHRRYAPRGYVALGTAYFIKRDWPKAAAAFSEAVNILETERGHNRWGLWALIRRGQVKDVMGDRPGAVADYKLALKQLDYWDLGDVAKKHLKKPAVLADLAGSPLPPP